MLLKFSCFLTPTTWPRVAQTSWALFRNRRASWKRSLLAHVQACCITEVPVFKQALGKRSYRNVYEITVILSREDNLSLDCVFRHFYSHDAAASETLRVILLALAASNLWSGTCLSTVAYQFPWAGSTIIYRYCVDFLINLVWNH